MCIIDQPGGNVYSKFKDGTTDLMTSIPSI